MVKLRCVVHKIDDDDDDDTHLALDHSATIKRNKSIEIFARTLIQHSVALRALLSTTKPLAGETSPFDGLPTVVQLDQSNGNPRSIMIFKAAWLVVMWADQLWDMLRRHEKKGQIDESWARDKKPMLRKALEDMTEEAVMEQVCAEREGRRYSQVQGSVKYW